MGFFDWITGNSAGKLIDTVAGGLDSMNFSDQERAGMFLELQKATAPQNVARRILAVMVTALWVVMVLLGTGLHLGGATESAKFVFQVLADVVNNPFMIIIGFYFLAHVVRAGKG